MKIAVWYHCKLSGDGIPDTNLSLNILCEQMTALKQSGLAEAADELHLCLNGPESDLLLVAALCPNKSKIVAHGPGKKSELPTLSLMRKWLPDHPGWLVCYHHSKGVTMREWGKIDIEFKALHRRTMERFVIWNWKQCVADLERGYEAVGCNLVHPIKRNHLPGRFFAGNFWWATANYLITLPSIPDNCRDFNNVGERCIAEGWVGSSPRSDVRFMDYERPQLYAL